MKRVASLFLAGSLAFAGNIYSKNSEEKKQISVPFTFKTTSKNEIQNVAISHDDKRVLVNTKYKVKIFNSEDGELIKTLNFNKIKKSAFSQDNTKLFILTKQRLYIYDGNTYKELGHIDKANSSYYGFVDFFIKGNLLGLIDYNGGALISIFDLKAGSKVTTFKVNHSIQHGDFSPNLKKIALTDSKSYIYNLDGELLTELSEGGYYDAIKWLDNKNVVVHSSRDNAYVFNVQTGKIVAHIMTGKNIDKIEILNKDNVLVFNNNIMKIFNISKSKFLNKEYIVKGKNIDDDVIYVDLSDDKTLLSIAYYSNNMKFYKTSEVFKNFINTNSNNNSIDMVSQENKKIVEKVTKQVVEPKVSIKKIIVEKKVKDTENKKPTLYIYASQTEGNVPLTVNFKFVANDEDGKIASYYVNFAGQEIMHKGNPTKSFNYTFKNAGKYKIMVSVKDNKGAITIKQVTITVKPKHEENFEDYKRSLMGQ